MPQAKLNGDSLVLALGVVYEAYKMLGSPLTHDPLAPIAHPFIPLRIDLLVTLASPLVCGCATKLNFSQIVQDQQNSLNFKLLNDISLSVIRVFGIPYLVIIFLHTNPSTYLSEIEVRASASTHFVKQSTPMIRNLYQLDVGGKRPRIFILYCAIRLC